MDIILSASGTLTGSDNQTANDDSDSLIPQLLICSVIRLISTDQDDHIFLFVRVCSVLLSLHG